MFTTVPTFLSRRLVRAFLRVALVDQPKDLAQAHCRLMDL